MALGEQVLQLLENGVSQYPKLEGRFPQVAGIQFAFDPSAPSGSRVLSDFVKVGDQYLDTAANYRLVTKAYMKEGRDGYTMLKECPVLVSLIIYNSNGRFCGVSDSQTSQY